MAKVLQSGLPFPFDGAILIVDDDELVTGVCKRWCDRLGHVCFTAESHDEALGLFQSNQPIDVVVIDHGVSNCLGSEFISSLKSIRSDVILVGSSGRDCRQEFAQAGVHQFIEKPWDLDQLNGVVACAMQFGDADVDLASCQILSVGQRVRIRVGEMRGLEGTVESLRGESRILVKLDLEPSALFVEIDKQALEAMA